MLSAAMRAGGNAVHQAGQQQTFKPQHSVLPARPKRNCKLNVISFQEDAAKPAVLANPRQDYKHVVDVEGFRKRAHEVRVTQGVIVYYIHHITLSHNSCFCRLWTGSATTTPTLRISLSVLRSRCGH